MAYVTVKFFSKSLNRTASFEMILPNEGNGEGAEQKEMKSLFLLHGYTGCAGNWVPEYLAQKYNFAIIMPNGENSFWLDGLSTGHKFATLLGEELPEYIMKTFRITIDAKHTGIMGMSMGGFGALHTALRYPERFGKIGAMSSALIVHQVAGMKEGEDNGMANYEYYRECFGEPNEVIASENNPETLVKKILAEGKEMPQIYMCCGTEDFLLSCNREFHVFLQEQSVEHIYKESKGIHDMVFWNEYTTPIIEWMFGEE